MRRGVVLDAGRARTLGRRLVFGRGMSPVATLVERSTRCLMLVGPPDGHRAELVADALAAAITTLPRQLTRSLPSDARGPDVDALEQDPRCLLPGRRPMTRRGQEW